MVHSRHFNIWVSAHDLLAGQAEGKIGNSILLVFYIQ